MSHPLVAALGAYSGPGIGPGASFSHSHELFGPSCFSYLAFDSGHKSCALLLVHNNYCCEH
ncbi:hypothetical protein B0F90DRAFT_1746074, partial [Multifurca ochricompacta]